MSDFDLDPAQLLTFAENAESFSRALKSIDDSANLTEYTAGAFNILEPGRELRTSWVMDCIDEHLEAVYDREITRLIFNVPPGMMKSLKTRVFFPTWVWTKSPEERFLGASYSHRLAVRDNRRARQLIESDWYAERWGDICRLSADSTARDRFENTAMGFMYATTIGGTTTGERGNYLMIDDPNNVKTTESEARREEVLFWFAEVAPTRLIDQTEDCIVVIQQRVHEQDVTGFALEADLGYEHVCIPMEYEATRQVPVTAIGWKDPRTEEGELAFPELFPREAVEQLKKQMRSWGGDYAVAGQLQQRPAPRGGGMFNKEKLNYLDSAPAGVRWCRGWDLAASKDRGARTAGVLFGVDPQGRIVIGDCQKGQLGPDEVFALIRQCAETDGRSVPISIPKDPGQAAVGQVAMLARELNGWTVEFTPETGSKENRARPFASQVNAGNVYIVRGDWNRDFVNELGSFPVGRYLDQIDAATRAYTYLLAHDTGGKVSFGGDEKRSYWRGA